MYVDCLEKPQFSDVSSNYSKEYSQYWTASSRNKDSNFFVERNAYSFANGEDCEYNSAQPSLDFFPVFFFRRALDERSFPRFTFLCIKLKANTGTFRPLINTLGFFLSATSLECMISSV